jgi:hypothetical protein
MDSVGHMETGKGYDLGKVLDGNDPMLASGSWLVLVTTQVLLVCRSPSVLTVVPPEL